MFVSRSPRARWLFAAGLLAALASCTATADSSPTPRSQGASGAPPAGFDPNFRRKVVLTAKPTAAVAEIEKFYADHLKPALSRDPRIGDVAVFVDASGSYVVELELRTPDAPAYSLALDVLGVGSTPEQAAQKLATFASYFAADASQVLVRRHDLSLDRGVLGTIGGDK